MVLHDDFDERIKEVLCVFMFRRVYKYSLNEKKNNNNISCFPFSHILSLSVMENESK